MTSPRHPRIVLAVTADMSLTLMTGLAERLVRAGWAVHVVSSGGPALTALGCAEGVSVHALPMRRDPDPARDAVALVRWVRLLRELRPDVVFAGTPKAGLLGMLAARIMRVPHRIYHVRGLRLETVEGWRRRVFVLVERLALSSSTSALSVSRSLAERLVTLGLAPAEKVVVLGLGSSNGVDVARFRPGVAPARVEGLDPSAPVIGFVGRLNADKGLDVLVEACRLLRDRGVEFQLLVVGGVDDGAGGHPLPVDARAVVTGHVDDTAPFYPLMRVLCLPTRREGFPNVVLEASASGIAVVTTDATGARDSVRDGETGSIVPTDDAPALADALQDVLARPELAKDRGAAGRAWAEREFARDLVQSRIVAHLSRSVTGAQDG